MYYLIYDSDKDTSLPYRLLSSDRTSSAWVDTMQKINKNTYRGDIDTYIQTTLENYPLSYIMYEGSEFPTKQTHPELYL